MSKDKPETKIVERRAHEQGPFRRGQHAGLSRLDHSFPDLAAWRQASSPTAMAGAVRPARRAWKTPSPNWKVARKWCLRPRA